MKKILNKRDDYVEFSSSARIEARILSRLGSTLFSSDDKTDDINLVNAFLSDPFSNLDVLRCLLSNEAARKQDRTCYALGIFDFLVGSFRESVILTSSEIVLPGAVSAIFHRSERVGLEIIKGDLELLRAIPSYDENRIMIRVARSLAHLAIYAWQINLNSFTTSGPQSKEKKVADIFFSHLFKLLVQVHNLKKWVK